MTDDEKIAYGDLIREIELLNEYCANMIANLSRRLHAEGLTLKDDAPASKIGQELSDAKRSLLFAKTSEDLRRVRELIHRAEAWLKAQPGAAEGVQKHDR